ncbi:MAG TPA: hypothetical protein VFA49_03365, partial [Chloroflexota bacterium]|nr:hypothetical protein [Chloroflexota bacterium]
LFRSRGGYRLWLLGGLGCLLLALGPALQPTSVPLPFAALGLWPPLAQFRTPSRLTMPAALGLAVALGYALAPLFRRVPSWIGMLVISVALLGRLLYAQAHDPFAVQTYPTYAAYNRLAREPGRFVLLEVPFGVRSGLERIGDGGEILEHYQHVHGKPLLNGMIARLPASVFAEYAGHPSLLLLSGGDVAESVPSLQADLADVIDWTGSRYVLVHHAMLDAEQAGRIDSLLDSSPLLERVGQEADLVVYAVRS